jgi:hypothetical protein
MRTQCIVEQLKFSSVGRREIIAAFDRGTFSSDAGALLLGKADAATGLIERLAGCFADHRRPELIEHSVRTRIGQHVLGVFTSFHRR